MEIIARRSLRQHACDKIYLSGGSEPGNTTDCSTAGCVSGFRYKRDNAVLLAWHDTLERYHVPRSLPDELMRLIARNREWLKKYPILKALATNPKLPPGVAIGLGFAASASAPRKRVLSPSERRHLLIGR